MTKWLRPHQSETYVALTIKTEHKIGRQSIFRKREATNDDLVKHGETVSQALRYVACMMSI